MNQESAFTIGTRVTRHFLLMVKNVQLLTYDNVGFAIVNL
jgi:hypothetical protein